MICLLSVVYVQHVADSDFLREIFFYEECLLRLGISEHSKQSYLGLKKPNKDSSTGTKQRKVTVWWAVHTNGVVGSFTLDLKQSVKSIIIKC